MKKILLSLAAASLLFVGCTEDKKPAETKVEAPKTETVAPAQEKKEEVTEGKGTYVGDTGMVERAAKHIANMWKEASKSSKKEEDEEPAKKGEKTTMTGKPMSGVQVSPIQKEK